MIMLLINLLAGVVLLFISYFALILACGVAMGIIQGVCEMPAVALKSLCALFNKPLPPYLENEQ